MDARTAKKVSHRREISLALQGAIERSGMSPSRARYFADRIFAEVVASATEAMDTSPEEPVVQILLQVGDNTKVILEVTPRWEEK